MAKPKFVERRRYPRAGLSVEVLCYQINDPDKRGTGILHFLSKNISLGGIFLETRVPLEEGAFIILKFTVPGLPKPITTRARIVAAREKMPKSGASAIGNIPGMCVEFTYLGHDEKKLIESFVNGLFVDKQ